MAVLLHGSKHGSQIRIAYRTRSVTMELTIERAAPFLIFLYESLFIYGELWHNRPFATN